MIILCGSLDKPARDYQVVLSSPLYGLLVLLKEVSVACGGVGYNKSMNYDYLTSTVKVSIPTFSESKTEPGTVFFNLQLEAKDNKWYVEKRFSEFDQLYNGLKNSYHSLPALPKKGYLFKMTDKDLDSRRLGLEDFLRKIIVRNDLMNSELVKQFLQLDKNAS